MRMIVKSVSIALSLSACLLLLSCGPLQTESFQKIQEGFSKERSVSVTGSVSGVAADVQLGVPFHVQLAKVDECGGYVYALNNSYIDWGDKTPGDSTSGGFVGVAFQGAFYGSHTYTQPGTYSVSITIYEECFNNATHNSTYGSGTATVTVHPSSPVSSLTVTPGTIQGGNPTSGNIIIAPAAPKGGVRVVLDVPDKNSQYVIVPASVFIPEGRTTLEAPFKIETKAPPTTPLNIKISAYSGVADNELSKPVLAVLTIK